MKVFKKNVLAVAITAAIFSFGVQAENKLPLPPPGPFDQQDTAIISLSSKASVENAPPTAPSALADPNMPPAPPGPHMGLAQNQSSQHASTSKLADLPPPPPPPNMEALQAIEESRLASKQAAPRLMDLPPPPLPPSRMVEQTEAASAPEAPAEDVAATEIETESVQTSDENVQAVLDSLQEEAAIASAIEKESSGAEPQFATGDHAVTISAAPPANKGVQTLNELPAPPSPAALSALGLMGAAASSVTVEDTPTSELLETEEVAKAAEATSSAAKDTSMTKTSAGAAGVDVEATELSASATAQFATGEGKVTVSTTPPANSDAQVLSELPAPPSPAVPTALGSMDSSEPQALLSVAPETSDEKTTQVAQVIAEQEETTQSDTPTTMQEKTEPQQAEQQQAMQQQQPEKAKTEQADQQQQQMQYWYVIPVMPYYPAPNREGRPQQPIIMMPYSAPTGAPYHVVPQQDQSQVQPVAPKKRKAAGSCSPKKSDQPEKVAPKPVGKCNMSGHFGAYGQHNAKQP